MSLPIRLLLALLAVAVLAPATASAEPIATPNVATSVREYRGIAVFSHFDRDTGQYRLAIRRPGTPPELLPIAPADRTFDADIGPNSDGEHQVIYQRCDETCDLFVYALSGEGGERPVRNANDPANDDIAPTLWRGRIAWARVYGEQQDRKVIVYTKRLIAPRSRPSTRVPGVPTRRCGDVEPRECGPTTGRTVEALELVGRRLAEVVSYTCDGCAGIAQSELRLADVRRRTSRQIAFQVAGLSGQSLIGPTFTRGRLGWYVSCLGDPGACQGDAGGPWRYDLSSRRYAKSSEGPARVYGFADLGAEHLRVEDCSVETNLPDFNANCRIESVEAPDYDRAERPRR